MPSYLLICQLAQKPGNSLTWTRIAWILVALSAFLMIATACGSQNSRTSFGDGSFVIGVDIKTGVYRNDGIYPGCTYAIAGPYGVSSYPRATPRSTSSPLQNLLSTAAAVRPNEEPRQYSEQGILTITLSLGWTVFETNDCGTWNHISD